MRQFEYNGYKDNNRVECKYLEVSGVAHERKVGRLTSYFMLIILFHTTNRFIFINICNN